MPVKPGTPRRSRSSDDEENSKKFGSVEKHGAVLAVERKHESWEEALVWVGRFVFAGLFLLATFAALARKADVDSSNSPSPGARTKKVEPYAAVRAAPAESLRTTRPRDWFAEEGNSCLALRYAAKGLACESFVVNSTDAVWRSSFENDDDDDDDASSSSSENNNNAVREAFVDFYDANFRSHDSKGQLGLGATLARTLATRRAYSDLRVRVAGVVCRGNDKDGYEAIRTAVFMGTNDGDSLYGPPTHHKVSYPLITSFYLAKDPKTNTFKIQSEWNLMDELLLLRQLGLVADKDTTYTNNLLVDPPPRCLQTQAGWGTTTTDSSS